MPATAEVSDNFKSIIRDFVADLSTTYPEFVGMWSQWSDASDAEYKKLYDYCVATFAERFFDIMYQNADIFKMENATNTMFLPGVSFKMLLNAEGVSEKTKQTLWKYLQLLLFNTIGSIDDKSKFGDAASIFDGIDETVLQDKLKETMEGLGEFFQGLGDKATKEQAAREFSFDADSVPKMEDIHEHLKGIFDGKIGRLAKELAEEISGDFTDLVGDDNTTTQDVIKNLMKNPTKMVGLVKKVGDRLTTKMNSGEISKDEIMREAGDIMAKMKEMGGGAEKLNDLFKQFVGKGAKVDTNAMDRMTKQSETKERMRKKMEEKKKFVMEQEANKPNSYVFRVPGEEQQKSALRDEELIAEFEQDAVKKTTKSKSGKNKNKKK